MYPIKVKHIITWIKDCENSIEVHIVHEFKMTLDFVN